MPYDFESYRKLIRNLVYHVPNHPEIKTIADMESDEFRNKIHLQYRNAFYKMVYGLSNVNEWQLLTKLDFGDAYSKKRYKKVEVKTWKD